MEKRTISINWKNIPSDWKCLHSFGIGEQKLPISLLELEQSIFMLGDLCLSKIEIENNPIYIAAPNDLPLKKLTSLLEKIIYEQRCFFDDFDIPYFLIGVFPSKEKNISAHAKLNAFLIFCSDLKKASEKKWQEITWVLSHEHFHTWNPFKFLPMFLENFDDLSWFIEGFTDYYGALIAYRANVLSLDSYIKETNNHLQQYHTSPYRNISNEKLKKVRYDDISTQLLPYQRGYLLALLWESKSSNKSLDALMQKILQGKDNSLTCYDIGLIAKDYIGDISISDIESYIIKGETIPSPKKIFDGNFELLRDKVMHIPKYRRIK